MDSYRKPEEQASQDPNNNNNNNQTTLYKLPLDIVYLIVNHLNYYDAVDFCVAYLSPIYDRFLKENNYSHSIPESKETKVKEFSGHGLFSACRKKLKEIKLTAGSFSTSLFIPDNEPIVWGGDYRFRIEYGKLYPSHIKSIIECNTRTFVICHDNSVYAFGENNFSELGLPASGWVTLTQILKNKEINKITNGYKHTLFLSKGDVFSTGSNSFNQLGTTYIRDSSSPCKVQVDEEIIDIAAGDFHSLILTKKGEVLGCGVSGMGQLGLDYEFMQKNFKKITIPGFVIQVAAGAMHSLFLNSKNEVYFLGHNKIKPFQIEFFKNEKIISIVARENNSFFLTEDGQVYQLVNKHDSQLHFTEELTLIELPEKIYSISAGVAHLALLSRNGNVYTLGMNQYGQLGYDTNNQMQQSPRKVELRKKTQSADTAQEKTESENNNKTRKQF